MVLLTHNIKNKLLKYKQLKLQSIQQYSMLMRYGDASIWSWQLTFEWLSFMFKFLDITLLLPSQSSFSQALSLQFVSEWQDLILLPCFQVHHGGAGTTAAGLKAAVRTNILIVFVAFGFASCPSALWSTLFLFSILVPNNHCTILWWPTFLGRASACQRSGTPTHPCWWILTSKVGWCNKFYARPKGKHEFKVPELFNLYLLLHFRFSHSCFLCFRLDIPWSVFYFLFLNFEVVSFFCLFWVGGQWLGWTVAKFQ